MRGKGAAAGGFSSPEGVGRGLEEEEGRPCAADWAGRSEKRGEEKTLGAGKGEHRAARGPGITLLPLSCEARRQGQSHFSAEEALSTVLTIQREIQSLDLRLSC